MSSITKAMGGMDLSMGPGLIGVVLDTGVGAGVSYGIGRTYAQYGKTNWAARNGARIAAIAGKGLAVVAAMLGAPQIVTGVLNSGGQAGVSALSLEKGLKDGRDKLGKRAVLIDKAAALPAGGSDIGALGKARQGAAPSWEQIRQMADAVT